MPQITRLQSSLLARILGLRETGALNELADLVIPVLSIEPFLLPPEGATPAPVGPSYSLQPSIRITTGFESVAGLGTDSGVLNVFGAGLVSGTDPAGKEFSHASPPNRDYEIWGVDFFLRKEETAKFDLDSILQLDDAVSFAARRIAGRSTHRYETSAGMNEETQMFVMFPWPFVVGANQQLFFRWRMVNSSAAAKSAECALGIFWRYV